MTYMGCLWSSNPSRLRRYSSTQRLDKAFSQEQLESDAIPSQVRAVQMARTTKSESDQRNETVAVCESCGAEEPKSGYEFYDVRMGAPPECVRKGVARGNKAVEEEKQRWPKTFDLDKVAYICLL